MQSLIKVNLWRLLLAASLVVPAGFFGFFAWDSRQRTLHDADRQIVSTVRLLSEQMARVLLADKLALRRVDQLIQGRSWDDITRSQRLRDQLVTLQAALPHLEGILLVTADGTAVASLGPPSPTGRYADREYFSWARDHPDGGIHVSRSFVGRVRQERFFAVSQRRSMPDGSFDGVIVLMSRPDYMSEFYGTFAGPEGLAIILMRSDGSVLSRYPAEGASQLPADTPLLAAASPGDKGTTTFRSAIDGELRVAGFSRIADADLVVAYLVSRAGILSSWRADLLRYGALMAVGSIALAGMTGLAMRHGMQKRAAVQRLESVTEASARETANRLRIETELHELSHDLEQRVTTRTSSLAEAAAQHARETALLAAVIQATPHAKIVINRDGFITMANAAAEALFGYQRDELLGQNLEILVPTSLRSAHAALRGHYMTVPSVRPMGARRDLAGLRKDGTTVPIEIALGPVETADGPAVIACVVDTSQRKQYEVALRQSNEELRSANQELSRANATIRHKSEEVEAFVYIVSHDLRTPLINLQGFSRELELGCADLRMAVDALGLPDDALRTLHTVIEQDIDSTLQYIRGGATKCDRLINVLLELSRTGQFSLSRERLNIGAIIAITAESLDEQIRAAQAEIDVGPLPEVTGDPGAVGQILANLISNAIKYAHPQRSPRIEVGGQTEGAMVHLWVRDNGVGIPDSAMPRLFHVFQRFHPKLADGDGIGLASVRRLVERHGGKVWADSMTGVGTTFHFSLPAFS